MKKGLLHARSSIWNKQSILFWTEPDRNQPVIWLKSNSVQWNPVGSEDYKEKKGKTNIIGVFLFLGF